MPPRTRGAKGTKASNPSKQNTSGGSPFKTPQKSLENSLVANRPKRICRLPSKYDDHSISPSKYIPVKPCHASTPILENKSSKITEKGVKTNDKKSESPVTQSVPKKTLPVKINIENSPETHSDTNNNAKRRLRHKPAVQDKPPSIEAVSTEKSLENCLVGERPKRICRLPSKFVDHSISPTKYVPVKPCHASTPILESKSSKVTKKTVLKTKEKKLESRETQGIPRSKNPVKRHIENLPDTSSDTNNNAKRRLRQVQDKTPPIVTATKRKLPKKVSNNSISFRIFENKKSQNEDNNLDVYEFTYDPNEEPPPAKKKRKRTVKRKPAQPKSVVFKYNYDKNVGKALEALKNVVSKKPTLTTVDVSPVEKNITTKAVSNENKAVKQKVAKELELNPEVLQAAPNSENVLNPEITKENPQVANTVQAAPNSGNVANHNSVRVEDIAADFELSPSDCNDINYSPVTTPQRPETPVTNHTLEQSVHNNDPLNLRRDLSFFDDNPVASSSMNVSTRHPQASPWRVEFGSLPIRWHANTYVKPNMTPAVESSFINSEDNRKKHVYTNLVDYSEPEVVQNQSNLKQTSIISFIREVVERSAQKKKRGRSVTPTKASNLFDDLSKTPNDKTPKKSGKANDKNSKKVDENVSNNSGDSNHDKENLNEINDDKKKRTKTAGKDNTFFGFDESEDQENVSPIKVDNPKVRALRPRARAVLQEINSMTGPMRALPLAAKSKITTSSDAVNKVYEEMKSAADAPVFPERGSLQKSSEVTAVNDATCDLDVDEESVHLFEDIELVHHLKPTRKSYGKAKKVTFRQRSTSDENQDLDHEQDHASSDEDDLADLTFTMPSFQPQKKAKKKKTKKQKMSKKEEKALEEWAAGFNSMCEDIEEVPLIVE